MSTRNLFWLTIVFIVSTLFILSACSSATTDEQAAAEGTAPAADEGGETEAEEAAPAQEPAEESDSGPASGSYYERALAGEFTGTTVEILGPFTDEDEVKFLESIKSFEEQSGIDIQYSGVSGFDSAISVRVDAGDIPDIANFAQPGLLARFVQEGHVLDVGSFLDEEYMQGQYDQSWIDMATMQGPDGPMLGGVWQRINGKSLIWYPIEEFQAAGYEIPTTWEEMLTLSDQIVADGDTPWCIGIGSGAATGWPATDWIEEIMLRTTSLEQYDAWTQGELPFDSPEVRNAFDIMANIFFNEDYVYGGSNNLIGIEFGDAPVPMFEDPPQCWLHKQGNFITNFFPAGVEAGKDYGFFYLPPIDEEYGRPFLVGGDIMAMMQDRDEVRAVMEFFTRGESLKGWLEAGGALSPHLDAELDWYGDDTERGIAQILKESTSFRYDGSDLMPGQVGTGTFWTGLVSYLTGAASLDTILPEIDASWPQD
ncbi:MAG: ABC transporter substrate-binding protein [Candidatus Promineifilaceae bacterium]|nr:ABC transporter substrate-binding protein [Candidatus Promineifilaceae bacterium]